MIMAEGMLSSTNESQVLGKNHYQGGYTPQ